MQRASSQGTKKKLLPGAPNAILGAEASEIWPLIFLKACEPHNWYSQLVRLGFVCKHWHGIVESRRFWKYVCLSAHKDIPFATLLAILQPRSQFVEVLELDSFVDSPEVLRLLHLLPNLDTLDLSGSHWRVDRTGTQTIDPSEDFILSSSAQGSIPIPTLPLRRARGFSNSSAGVGLSRSISNTLSSSPRAMLGSLSSSPTTSDGLGLRIDTNSPSSLKTLFLSSSLHQWTEEDLFTILECTPQLERLYIGARRSSAQADPSYAVSIDPTRTIRGISLRCQCLKVLDISSLHDTFTEEFDFLLPKLETVFVDDKKVYQLVKANLAKYNQLGTVQIMYGLSNYVESSAAGSGTSSQPRSRASSTNSPPVSLSTSPRDLIDYRPHGKFLDSDEALHVLRGLIENGADKNCEKQGIPLIVELIDRAGDNPAYFKLLRYFITQEADMLANRENASSGSSTGHSNDIILHHGQNSSGPSVHAARYAVKHRLRHRLHARVVNHVADVGRPLMYAILKGDMHVVRLLVRMGANPNHHCRPAGPNPFWVGLAPALDSPRSRPAETDRQQMIVGSPRNNPPVLTSSEERAHPVGGPYTEQYRSDMPARWRQLINETVMINNDTISHEGVVDFRTLYDVPFGYSTNPYPVTLFEFCAVAGKWEIFRFFLLHTAIMNLEHQILHILASLHRFKNAKKATVSLFEALIDCNHVLKLDLVKFALIGWRDCTKDDGSKARAAPPCAWGLGDYRLTQQQGLKLTVIVLELLFSKGYDIRKELSAFVPIVASPTPSQISKSDHSHGHNEADDSSESDDEEIYRVSHVPKPSVRDQEEGLPHIFYCFSPSLWRYLMTKGADLQATDQYGRTTLECAIIANDAAGVYWLLNNTQNPMPMEKDLFRLALNAVRVHEQDSATNVHLILEMFINEGMLPHDKFPIELVLSTKSVSIFKLLTQKEWVTLPSFTDDKKKQHLPEHVMILMLSCFNHSPDFFQPIWETFKLGTAVTVKERPGDPDHPADISDGSTLLHVACHVSWKKDVFRFLIMEKGLDMHARNARDETPFLVACKAANLAAVRWLLYFQVKSDARSRISLSPVNEHGSTEASSSSGSDTNMPEGPLLVARKPRRNNKQRHPEDNPPPLANTEEAVRAKRVLFSEKDREGNTGLHLAVDALSFGLVQFLLHEGHPVNVVNKKNETPIEFCFSDRGDGHYDRNEGMFTLLSAYYKLETGSEPSVIPDRSGGRCIVS